MSTRSLRQRRDLALGSGTELFYDEPLEIVRGEGVYLFDRDGRRYVDLYNNVPCVGHANPAVVRAMAEQQATLNVHNRYLHEGIVAFAERLAALHHDGIESVVFSCSGTEANDVAIQMARVATGHRGLICTDGAYHGNSELVDALTMVRPDTTKSGEIRSFPTPDRFHALAPDLDESCLCEAYLDRVDQAIVDLQAAGIGVAALILCPILANEGLPDIPAGFLARAAERIRAAGGLVIADEVQSGYGRTGRWWGYQGPQAVGFEPDIVVMGKPMGNGLPLAATAAGRDLVNRFRGKTGYFNTFSSSPLQAAVGMAVLYEIERLDLVRNAAELGDHLLQALSDRADRHPGIGDVRGRGLFLGIEMVTPGSRNADELAARDMANRLKDKGFLVSNAGRFDNVVKIRPPLVFSRDDADAFVAAFDSVLGERGG